MESNKETKSEKGLSLKISEAILEGTLFLLFGSKEWQKGKKAIPPIYIVGIIIIFIIFILIIK